MARVARVVGHRVVGPMVVGPRVGGAMADGVGAPIVVGPVVVVPWVWGALEPANREREHVARLLLLALPTRSAVHRNLDLDLPSERSFSSFYSSFAVKAQQLCSCQSANLIFSTI